VVPIVSTLTQLHEDFFQQIEQQHGKKLLRNKKVFLKPNIGYPKPAPFTTSLEVLEQVVETVYEAGAKEIIIAEGSTSHSSALENFKLLGFKEALQNFPISFVDLAEEESVAITIRKEVTHFLPTILLEMDYRLSLPVIKFYNDDEGKLFLSNAVKNFFGLPPKARYKSFEHSYMRDALHKDLHQSVADIYLAVEKFAPFHLYICDGMKLLKGFAEEGAVESWGKIIIATNAVEADLKVLELLQRPPPRFLGLLKNEKVPNSLSS